MELSPAQEKAIRHERINENVFAFVGLTTFCLVKQPNLFMRVLEAVGAGATAALLTSLLFPVNIRDVLDFGKQQGLGGISRLPAGTYAGEMLGYTVRIGDYEFENTWGIKYPFWIPVRVDIQEDGTHIVHTNYSPHT